MTRRRAKKKAAATRKVDINDLLGFIAEEREAGRWDDSEADELAEAYRRYQPLREDFSVARLRADRQLDGETE